MGRLLALDHTALAGRQESKSEKWEHQSFCVAPAHPPSLDSMAQANLPNEATTLVGVWCGADPTAHRAGQGKGSSRKTGDTAMTQGPPGTASVALPSQEDLPC